MVLKKPTIPLASIAVTAAMTLKCVFIASSDVTRGKSESGGSSAAAPGGVADYHAEMADLVDFG